jgi:uncharacterized membrane protein
MAMPHGAYPAAPPIIRFDVINQAWQLLQRQMGQWVLLTLVYLLVVGAAYALLTFVPVIGPVVYSLLAMVLAGGLYKAALKGIRGEGIVVSDLFDVGNIAVPLIVAGVLIGLGAGAAAILLVLPAFVVAGLWMFDVPLIVDKQMDGLTAMRESWNALRGQWFMAAVFYLVITLIAGVGAVACGLGVLFTLPIAVLSIALLYRDFFPEDTLSEQPPAPPSPF